MEIKQPNQVKKQPRRKYSAEFKEQALEKAKREGVAQTSRDLGLSESLLYSWRAKRTRTGNSFEEQKLQQAELSQLKRELKRLQTENAFLKKAAAYFAKDQEQSTQ